jgi:hypothetical protein
LATQTRAPQKSQALQNQFTARVLRQPTTAVPASHAQQKPAHLHHAGKIALRAPSTVMHARLVTHVTLDQLLVATSAATGAQHLLPAAASFRPTTAHRAPSIATPVMHDQLAPLTVTHVRLVMVQHLVASKTDQLVLSTVMHDQLVTIVHHALLIVTHVRLVTTVHHARSTATLDQLVPLTATHVRLAMAQRLVASKTVHHALSTVTHVRLAMTVHHVPSIVTHAQRATHAMVAHVQHLALSIAQIHEAHASSMTAHASSTATTATTAPTVVQTALTV